MRQITSKRLIAFIIVVLVTTFWVVSSQAQTQAKVSGEQDKLSQQFHKARENFLKKDFKDAAAEIRKGEAFVKQEAGQATGEAKQALSASVQELDKLADEVQKRTVSSVKELERTFARAHYALALHYLLKASESWGKKAISEAGQDLKAAAVHLENGLAWAGHRLEGEGVAAVKEAKQMGEKMETGAGWVASEVSKGINAIRKGIDEASHKLSLSMSSTHSPVQISKSAGGPVDLSTAIKQVAKQSIPAVVAIEVTENREVENPLLPFSNDPNFRRFFWHSEDAS